MKASRLIRMSFMALTAAASLSVSLQAQMTPAMAKADSLYRASSWAEAASAYDAIARADTSNGIAFFRAGVAYETLARYDDAARVLKKALAMSFQPAATAIRLARVYALTNRADSALGFLELLPPMQFGQMGMLTTQKDFASISSTPRFKTVVTAMEKIRFPCRSNPKSRELDYWAGMWDVTVSGQPSGTNEVKPMLGGCALLENWTDMFGGEGKSLNYFDPNTGKWRQIWVADNGGVLDYTGEFTNGAMRFQGVTIGPNGARTLQKLTFFPIAADTVRQFFESSTDEGKTWTPGFDGLYVRRKN